MKERVEAIRKVSNKLREDYIAADATGMMTLVPISFQDLLNTINHLNDYASLLEENQTSHRD